MEEKLTVQAIQSAEAKSSTEYQPAANAACSKWEVWDSGPPHVQAAQDEGDTHAREDDLARLAANSRYMKKSYLERMELCVALLEVSCHGIHRRPGEFSKQDEACASVVVPC